MASLYTISGLKHEDIVATLRAAKVQNADVDNDITIYQLHYEGNKELVFAIISISLELDEYIKNLKANGLEKTNALYGVLRTANWKPVFGRKENLIYL